MQPLTLSELQQKILSLNSENNPFQYSISGNQITGNWKITDVKWTVILGGGKVDKNYDLNVTLDEATHSYDYKERKTNSGSKWSFDPGTGSISFGGSGSVFSGKMTEKEFGAGAGTSVKQNGQEGNTYQYAFDTKQIKDPLFKVLNDSGWQLQKSSLFSKLFKK